jgi:hypothetical protein
VSGWWQQRQLALAICRCHDEGCSAVLGPPFADKASPGARLQHGRRQPDLLARSDVSHGVVLDTKGSKAMKRFLLTMLLCVAGRVAFGADTDGDGLLDLLDVSRFNPNERGIVSYREHAASRTSMELIS